MLRLDLCVFFASLLAAGAAQAAASGPASNFEVQPIAEGVYAVIRQDPPGLMVDANSVFIVNDDDVVVVDTSGAPSTSKEVVAALRKITTKPVRYVVNTHWHDDHITGDPVYREAFPGVEFIGHAKAREYLPGQGAINRKGFLEGAPQAVEMLRGLLAQNKSLGGGELTAEERASYESDIRLAELAVREGPGIPLTLPTIAIEERLTLYRGDRVIDIRHLGRGHTGGDLVVHLPKEGVVITGDLVVWPVPLVGSEQSYVGDWSATLEKVLALKPAVIVPGHGPVLRDDSYVKILSRMFASIQEQTKAAVARGETLEQARKSVDLEELRKILAGDSPVRSVLFRTYVAGPAVAAAFREASGKGPV
ncbi:MAG TPA: MBL fold metallo-hydrolase [Thermoanaerobaculia bacterium]|nr:MBL fold metallo-hydrolase [Thermoanaerobaculia bacterium]